MEYGVNLDFACQHLYFITPSCPEDGEGLFFIGEENDNPNVFYKDFATGKITQITHNENGVYPCGLPGKGLGKATVCLDKKNARVFFCMDDKLYCGEKDGTLRVLCTLPKNVTTAYMHVSADGTRVVMPTTDARVLESAETRGAAYPKFTGNIDERIQHEGLCSWLRVFDTETGEEVLCEEVPNAWITHAQFHPKNNEWIMYNHEWAMFGGVRRMWLWNGKYHRALRTIDDGRSIHDWVCHEVWSPDGEYIIYHGDFAKDKRNFVRRLEVATGKFIEIPLPEAYRHYGHFNIAENGLLVSDGYYYPEEKQCELAENIDSGARWITLVKVDWEKGTLEWIPLERHDTSWSIQDSHPHPSFSPDCKRIFYTTDAGGKLHVCSCAVEK